MATHSRRRETVEQLAEEFVERYRRGERPPLSEYAERYPEHAEQIRDLFPALVMMEQIAPDSEGARCRRLGGSPRQRPGEHPERLGDYRDPAGDRPGRHGRSSTRPSRSRSAGTWR